MGALTDRRDSDYEGEDTNLNVQWISHPLFWVFYVAIIAVLRWALFFVPESYISTEHAWTAWNLIHAVLSFLLLHQTKGTPIWQDQGAYQEDTFWEQIDQGRPWTPARKVFLVVPFFLFMIASHFTNYEPVQLVANFAANAVLVVAKLPEMMGVRLIGRAPTPKKFT